MDKPIYVRLDPNETVLEKHPWVSYSLMGIWIVGALVIRLWPAPDLRPLDVSLEQLKYSAATPIHPEFESVATMFLGKSEVAKHPIEIQYQNANGDLSRTQQAQLYALGALKGQAAFRLGLNAGAPTLTGFLWNPLFHQSALVLLINLMLVYMVGALLEDRWGKVFHIAFIVAAGLFASFVALLLHRIPLPFFSGSCITAALLGAYCVRFFGTGLHFKTWFWQYGSGFAIIPSWVMLPVLLVTPFAATLISAFFGKIPPHPATFTILLLFGFGLTVAFVFKFLKLEPHFSGSDFDALAKDEQLHIKVDRALSLGQTKDAYNFLKQGVREHPNDLDILGRFWDQAVRMGRVEEALQVGLVLMEADRQDGAFEEGFFIWKEWVRAIKPDQPLSDPVHLELMKDLALAGFNREADDIAKALTLRNAPRLSLDEFHKFIAEIVPINARVAIASIETRLQTIRKTSDKQPLEIMAQQLRQSLPAESEDEANSVPEAIDIAPLNPNFNPDAPPLDGDPFRPTMIDHLKLLALAKIRFADKQLFVTTMGKEIEKRLPLTSVKAIYAAKITPMGGEPELLLDVFLDDPMSQNKQHRCLRWRMEPFDADTCQALLPPLYQETQTHWPQYAKGLRLDALDAFHSAAEFATETYGTMT